MKYTGLRRKLSAIAAGATFALLLPATAADAANTAGTQVYSGNGWKALPGIHSLSGDGTGYTIQFASADARTKLGPAAKQAAAQLTSVTGIKFTVSTALKASPEKCATQPRHVLTLGTKYRPFDGKRGMSRAWHCYNTGDHSVWGGWSWIDTEYWSRPDWFSGNKTTNAAILKNAINHEIGHMVGLNHPNKDLNHDGKTADFECPLTPKKYRPLMCSPNGGYTTADGGGKFTSLETPGLKQLAANWTLPAPVAPGAKTPFATTAPGIDRGALGGAES
ncbi:hypothetical protein OG741_18235 [Streptomyces sp. NBC_01410]|uniref:hypothetical protein n=1 Tax=Streptomyces sp. NBC_01410 TaxID=2903856 RepID=UPI003251623A